MNPSIPLYIGIDWAQDKHAVCILDGEQRRDEELTQDAKAIEQWVRNLQKQYPQRELCIAVEQKSGPLVYALLEHPTLVLYPINPKQAARYREALYPSGPKTDPIDAHLLARFVQGHKDHLKPLRQDSPLTRKLDALARGRRKLVEQRKQEQQRLSGALKAYFPFMLTFPYANIRLSHQQWLKWLKKYPTLKQLQQADPRTLRRRLRDWGIDNREKQDDLIQKIRAAKPLTQDAAVIEPQALMTQTTAKQIEVLNTAIEQFEQQLATALAEHEDAEIFRSVPGAGDALIPRLIAAFGDDRERFQAADEVASVSGIAPVTRSSGKNKVVVKRFACPKFLRQTFVEFADQARRWCPWSRAYFQQKKDKGQKTQAILRALAFKWIRIFFRMWKTKKKYNEAKYLQGLRIRNPELYKSIEAN